LKLLLDEIYSPSLAEALRVAATMESTRRFDRISADAPSAVPARMQESLSAVPA
jgi:hypothetical protein